MTSLLPPDLCRNCFHGPHDGVTCMGEGPGTSVCGCPEYVDEEEGTIIVPQDERDGAAIRQLTEALPEGWVFGSLVRGGWPPRFDHNWVVSVLGPPRTCDLGEEHRSESRSGSGKTIEAAALEALEALESAARLTSDA